MNTWEPQMSYKAVL